MAATFELSESSVEELAEIAGVHGGVEVRARFHVFESPKGIRHEIVLEARGHRAVVDVPRGGDPHSFAESAMAIFGHSIAARV